MHSKHNIRYPILSQPWSGRVTSISLSMWIDEPTLRGLLDHIGQTLQLLHYENAIDFSDASSFAPYNLHVLTHLGLVCVW